MELQTKIKERIKAYPDFPKDGVNFIDIFPLFNDHELLSTIVTELNKHSTSLLAGPESRAFLLIPAIQAKYEGKTFIPLRKEGKLPHNGDLITFNYEKEYGVDQLQFRPSDILAGEPEVIDSVAYYKITFIDDILATGGTSWAFAQAVREMNQRAAEGGLSKRFAIEKFVFVGEIEELQGRQKLETIAPVISLAKL